MGFFSKISKHDPEDKKIEQWPFFIMTNKQMMIGYW